jgi:predicted permease
MNDLTQQVVILILMMALGFLLARLKIINGEGRALLTQIVLNVTSPLLVIKSFQMQYETHLLINMGLMALFGFLSMGAFFALGKLWPVADEGKKKVLWQTTVFSNCGFMGYPLLFSLLGDTGVTYGSVYVMVFTIFTWTAGVRIYAGKSGTVWDVLKQPGMIAVFVGLLLFLTGWRLPVFVNLAINDISIMNTPLAMMIIGALVAEGDFKLVFREGLAFAASAVRLVALPALALGAFWVLWRLGVPGAPALGSDVVAACVLITAMPVAANVAIFASMYQVRPQFAAQTVLVSTLLSVATVPLWMFLLRLVVQALAI